MMAVAEFFVALRQKKVFLWAAFWLASLPLYDLLIAVEHAENGGKICVFLAYT